MKKIIIIILLICLLYLTGCQFNEEYNNKRERQLNIWTNEKMNDEIEQFKNTTEFDFHISWENTYLINNPRIHKIDKYYGKNYYFASLNEMSIREGEPKNKREYFRISIDEYNRIIDLDEESFKNLTRYKINYMEVK